MLIAYSPSILKLVGKLEIIPIAAIGRQLKQSVKVFHSLMLYRRLPAEDNMFHISVFLILLFVFIIDRLPQKCVNKFFVRPFLQFPPTFLTETTLTSAWCKWH